jgi:hypothetical protein
MDLSTPYSRPRTSTEKALPQNLEAERAILGAILLNDTALKTAREKISFTDFFHQHHREIYKAMLALDEKQVAIDLVTLTEQLLSEQKIQSAGGAGYLAQLVDGVPRVSNVGHYCEIVRQKSALRSIIITTEAMQARAFEDQADPAAIAAELRAATVTNNLPEGNPAVVIGASKLLLLKVPPATFVIDPVLTVGGTMMIFGPKSVGKSYIGTEIAFRLALGPATPLSAKIFIWPITRRFRVLYVYGEMHVGTIQERIRQIGCEHGILSLPEDFDAYLGTMCKEYQRLPDVPRGARLWRPSISSEADRKFIQERLVQGGYEVLVLDNKSTLYSASQEGDSERAAVLQNWYMDVNQLGISVIELHHAGKGGDQLGSSTNEHILDSVVHLLRPQNYERDQQLRAEVRIKHIRHEARDTKLLLPFEVTLQTDENGATWATRPTRGAQRECAFEMFGLGMKPPAIARDLNISERTVYRYQKQYDENKDPKHWTDEKD